MICKRSIRFIVRLKLERGCSENSLQLTYFNKRLLVKFIVVYENNSFAAAEACARSSGTAVLSQRSPFYKEPMAKIFFMDDPVESIG